MVVPRKANRRVNFRSKEEIRQLGLSIVARRVREKRLSHLEGEEMDSAFGMTPIPYYKDTRTEILDLMRRCEVSIPDVLGYFEELGKKEVEIGEYDPPEVWYDAIFLEDVMGTEK